MRPYTGMFWARPVPAPIVTGKSVDRAGIAVHPVVQRATPGDEACALGGSADVDASGHSV